jgi:FKBP-type peptidyl-prolyl cis-trans isomerase
MSLRLIRPLLPIGLSVLLLAAAACSDSPTAPTGVTSLSSIDLRAGTGATAASGSTVTVNYTVWLYDAARSDQKGVQIESSVGTAPFQFVLGAGDVIAGWDEGVPGMREGGLRRLVVPASLAYGSTRRNAVPPDTPLVFEIELLSIAAAG